MEIPFSQAAENNKEAILEVLRDFLTEPQTVLEIGSGTGQHGVFFAAALPHIKWQFGDQRQYHSAIHYYSGQASLSNLLPPLDIEVSRFNWQTVSAHSVFSANTAHIMSLAEVELMFCGVAEVLENSNGVGSFLLYGPFNRDGRFTSESNRQFDQMLRRGNPTMGIRDDQELCRIAHQNRLDLTQDIEMPANNRILCWALRD